MTVRYRSVLSLAVATVALVGCAANNNGKPTAATKAATQAPVTVAATAASTPRPATVAATRTPPTPPPPPPPPPAPTTPAAPQYTPDALAKSIRDNRSFMARASTDKLAVSIDGNLVRVEIQPNLINETDALSVASATELVAAKAIFSTYPDAQFIGLHLLTPLTDQNGRTNTEEVVFIQLNRQTAAAFDYNGLRDRIVLDNKALFCLADKYQISPVVYRELKERGCLTGPAKL